MLHSRSGGFELLVPHDRRAQIEQQVAEAKPRETAGLLAGRAFADTGGPWALVTSIAGDANIGELGRVILAPAVSAAFRASIHRADPAAEILGWFHSHPYPSSFSSVDMQEQRAWTLDHQVGLLAFMDYDADDWCIAYRGPGAELLSIVPPEQAPTPDIPARDAALALARPDARTPNRTDKVVPSAATDEPLTPELAQSQIDPRVPQRSRSQRSADELFDVVVSLAFVTLFLLVLVASSLGA